jgi:hypothetical protein
VLSSPSMWPMAVETEVPTTLYPAAEDLVVPPPRRTARAVATRTEWSEIYESPEFREAVTRLERTAVASAEELTSPNETSALEQIRRYYPELTLFLAACAVLVALLAWWYPRSSSSPVQVHPPVSHLSHPADRHRSR